MGYIYHTPNVVCSFNTGSSTIVLLLQLFFTARPILLMASNPIQSTSSILAFHVAAGC